MKPTKLTINAFGPYKEKVIIDFTELGENGIFLITGDTGAGKTSIFDAISYAIFGEVSGSNRPIQSIRSDFADLDTDTFVELEFIHKNIKYKIFRNPSYDKPKKKGEGFTKKAADASLEYGDRVISGIKNVDIKIEEILGINAKQFKQIAMLAQGEFLKILFADSKDRTEIFRKIFDTNIYNLISKKLKERLKENEEKLNALKNSFVTNTANILWNEIININAKELNEIDIENILEKLKSEIEKNKEENLKFEEIVNKYEKELKEQEEIIKKQEELNLKIDNFNFLLIKQKEYKIKEKEVIELKNKIVKNQRIKEIIKPKEDRLKNQKQLITNIEKELENLKSKISKETGKEAEYGTKIEMLNRMGELVKCYNECVDVEDKLLDKFKLIKKIDNLEENKAKEVNKYKKLQEEYKLLNKECLEKEEEFFKEQAGIIAEKLENNKPCPVCGSKEHPNIAKKSMNVLSKEELDNLKKNLDKKQKERQLKQEECIQINSQIKTLIEELKQEDINNEEFNFLKFKNILKEKYMKNNVNLQEYKISLNTLYEGITNKNLNLEKFEYDKFKDDVLNAINMKKGELIKDKTLEEEKNKQLKTAQIQFNEFAEDYQTTIIKIGFMTEKEYKDVLMSDKEIENSQKYIEEFNQNVTINNTKINELEKEIKGKTKLDLSKEKEKLQEQKTKLEENKKIQINIKGKFASNLRIYEKLLKNSKELKTKIKDFIIYDELSRTANGTLTGKKRIEFEQYVQATYFDMVITEANKRLLKMTENRYLLIRKDEPEKISDKIGLDLEVIDNYNGKKRDVKSLSGGEAFKAALSLALGLSDIIQSYSGGVVIDTLFIDEGFGSLDTESREQAINTLSLLIDSNKLIGIISHVTELKERIDKKIVVIKTNDGSKIYIEK